MTDHPAIDECIELPDELTPEQALRLAISLHQHNRLDEAEEIYRRVLEAAPDFPDAMHFYGILRAARGHTQEAIDLIERALAQVPDYVEAHNNLGNIYLQSGQNEQAASAYWRVLALRPDYAVAYNNLGIALKRLGRYVDAIDALMAAVKLDPQSAAYYHGLRNVFARQDELEDAIRSYREAIAQRPYNVDYYRHICKTLYLIGEVDQAAEILRLWLRRDPANPLALHMLSAYTGENIPERASDEFVQQTFDGFADSFDKVLQRLEYSAPVLIEQAVRRIVGADRSLDVLDAGCGTGLCGPLLRPFSRRLDGVDISERMLQKAAERGVYDELIAGELTRFLDRADGTYDLIASADTLCYFGDLTEVFEAAAKALRPGGHVVFTVEKLASEQEPFRLNAHGRYSHGAGYIEDLAAAAGLRTLGLDEAQLRLERGEPVIGLVVTAARP